MLFSVSSFLVMKIYEFIQLFMSVSQFAPFDIFYTIIGGLFAAFIQLKVVKST